MALHINGSFVEVPAGTPVSLLDLLREHLDLSGTKKGYVHANFGAALAQHFISVNLEHFHLLMSLRLAKKVKIKQVFPWHRKCSAPKLI